MTEISQLDITRFNEIVKNVQAELAIASDAEMAPETKVLFQNGLNSPSWRTTPEPASAALPRSLFDLDTDQAPE